MVPKSNFLIYMPFWPLENNFEIYLFSIMDKIRIILIFLRTYVTKM